MLIRLDISALFHFEDLLEFLDFFAGFEVPGLVVVEFFDQLHMKAVDLEILIDHTL